MIDELYEKFNYLFEKYGDPKKWRWRRHFINSKFDIASWDIDTLDILYVYYLTDGLKEAIAIYGPIPKVHRKYYGDIDNLISAINSTPNLDSLEVIYISNEINNLDHLNKLKDTYPDKKIIVNWNNEDAYIDDVISAIYMIDYYKQVISETNLSPLEKITMAYDIVKSFYYKNNNFNNNNITKTVNSGFFRCCGFVKLFNRILTEFGIPAKYFSVEIDDESHARTLVHVTDEKYGLNQIFVFDPTFDSVSNVKYYKFNEESAETIGIEKDGYTKGDSLCQYRHFLVPFISYEKVFPNSRDEIIPEKPHSKEELYKCLHTNQQNAVIKALSTENFIKLLYKVRLAEGYSADNIPKVIQEALVASGYQYYSIDTLKDYIDGISKDTKKMAA